MKKPPVGFEEVGTAVGDANYEFLADLIRHNTQMTPDARHALADLVLDFFMGRRKRSRRFEKKVATIKNVDDIATRVLELEASGMKTKTAVYQAADEFDKSPTWVYKAVGIHRSANRACSALMESIRELLNRNASNEQVGLAVQQCLQSMAADRFRRLKQMGR